MENKKTGTLYRKDNTSFTFVVSGEALNSLQKVKLTCFKRDKNNKRTDMAVFFEDYRSFASLLKIFQIKWEHAKEFSISRFGGTGGARKLHWSVKEGKLKFAFNDELIKEKPECKQYAGKLLFNLSEPLDIVEFFSLQESIWNWELTQIGKIIKSDFEQEV